MLRMRRVWVLAFTLLGCGTFFGLDQPHLGDGGTDGPPVPDGGVCTTASVECASADVLRTCNEPGVDPIDTVCAWGCLEAPAHCGRLVPAGGAVTSDDLAADPQLVDVTVDTVTINSDTGAIGPALTPTSIRGAGEGVVDGIAFETRGTASVFRVGSLAIDGPVTVTGSHAVAVVSAGAIRVNAVVDMRGTCTLTTAGPGGFPGGPAGEAAGGSGAGMAGTTINEGGGGGGHGGAGGAGGRPFGAGPSGGASFGMPDVAQLVGGGGGGGGASVSTGGAGGGGGGALQLASNTRIEIATGGGINAGGCGGKAAPGAQNGCGGGGGAGGTILLEAPVITIGGTLAVNGGGGAGGSDSGQNGQAGALARSAASGGAGAAGGVGGAGAAAADINGSAGAGAMRSGGGGGAIGRMRFHTRAGSATIEAAAVLSPSLDDGTTTTEAAATIE